MNIYCRGQIVPAEEATVSAVDHGFLYGMGLFETFRSHGGRVVFLDHHIARMKAGCAAFGIEAAPGSLLADPPPFRLLRDLIGDLLAANRLDDAVFRYTVTGGEAGAGLPADPYTAPSELIYVRPLPPPLPDEGHRIHILGTTRTEPEIFPRGKSLHYANSIAAHRELLPTRSSPTDEGMMLTRDGRLAEGVVSNLFLVHRGRLLTPGLSAWVLPGVTRAIVLRLASGAGITAEETDFGLDDLAAAEAIFTTNSTRGIAPVLEVCREGRSLWRGNSATHPVVNRLRADYRALIKVDSSY